MLDKAQKLNTSAREVFEFTARCCSTATKGRGGGNGGGGNGSLDTVGDNGENNHLSSPFKDCAAADTGSAEGINSNIVAFSLSDGQLTEGEALLLKIRRCTSAPSNPDDRAAKPKARATVHPGVRHRVEVCMKKCPVERVNTVDVHECALR